MSSQVAETATPVWQMPRVDNDRRALTGTAAGIAREIGIDPIYIRVSFVVLTIAGGWGLVLYIAAFVVMRIKHVDGPYEPIAKGPSPQLRMLAFAMVAVGLVVLSSLLGLTFLGVLVWPSAMVGAAIAVAFDRTSVDQRRNLTDISRTENMRWRILLGIGCLFAGVITALSLSLSFWQAISGIIVAGLVLVGAAIVFAPIITRLAEDLLSERRLRIRSEERADMAAHLHDSVLQTLSLIQKRSGDTSVVSLARQQERELRDWLFDEKELKPSLGFRAELERQMGEIEVLYNVPIDVVVVGDRRATGEVDALLGASREAASNAAKHSQTNKIDVYAEVADQKIEVFVRDHGIGFDPAAVDADRAGLRDSVIGRMERHGGSATIGSVFGRGTEIELVLPLADTAPLPAEVQT